MTTLGLDRRTVLQAGLCLAAGRPAAAAPVSLRAADFADSVGVNTHLDSEPYLSNFPLVERLLVQAGIRHLRDQTPAANRIGQWRKLADATGVRFDLLVSPVRDTVAEILACVQAMGVERLAALEGQNEGDGDWFMAQPAARPSWDRAVVAFQRQVYLAVRARYGVAALPFLSPSVLDYKPANAVLIRGAAPYSDLVSIHSYVQGRQEPETADDYSAIGWYLRNMRDGFKPGATAITTEAGYNNLLEKNGGVSERAAGIYMPRLLLNNFAAGVRRTYLYELFDEGTSGTDSEQHWGIVRHDGTPKPAFTAVAALLHSMGPRVARPATARTSALSIATPGAPADMRLMVFARDDGTSVAALWRAVRCWDPDRNADLPIAAKPQRVVLTETPRFCRWQVLGDTHTWRDHAATGSLDLPVGAAVTLLWFG